MEQINDGRLDAEVRIVISDVEDAGILSLARDFQIPGSVCSPGPVSDKARAGNRRRYRSIIARSERGTGYSRRLHADSKAVVARGLSAKDH